MDIYTTILADTGSIIGLYWGLYITRPNFGITGLFGCN